MYCLGHLLSFTCKQNFYEGKKMLLHDLSWIPIFVQSLISISFEIGLSKLNNNKKKIEKWLFKINQVQIMRFKLFLGYMLFVTIPISLMCQKLDLIETESETWKSQMYGHNAGQPVSSLYTKYILPYLVIRASGFCYANDTKLEAYTKDWNLDS